MSEAAVVQTRVFSGHESFPIRFTWLTKAVRHSEPDDQRDLFSRPDAMETLGVGKNMVRSMRSWAILTGMLETYGEATRAMRLRPTKLGALLFGTSGLDPFMEDPGTVWLLHWSLASNHRLATWHWAFNKLRDTEFDRAQLVKHLLQVSRDGGGREIAQDTISRDVDCFLRTYVPSDPDKRLSREELLDCPLTELRLIRRNGAPNGYTFVRGRHESLPDQLFAYCLFKFWNRQPNALTIRFDEIAYGIGSPGQIFKLSENALVERLHRLPELTGKAARYDDTAGLRQVFRDSAVQPLTMLHNHYESKSREARRAANR